MWGIVSFPSIRFDRFGYSTPVSHGVRTGNSLVPPFCICLSDLGNVPCRRQSSQISSWSPQGSNSGMWVMENILTLQTSTHFHFHFIFKAEAARFELEIVLAAERKAIASGRSPILPCQGVASNIVPIVSVLLLLLMIVIPLCRRCPHILSAIFSYALNEWMRRGPYAPGIVPPKYSYVSLTRSPVLPARMPLKHLCLQEFLCLRPSSPPMTLSMENLHQIHTSAVQDCSIWNPPNARRPRLIL